MASFYAPANVASGANNTVSLLAPGATAPAL